MTEGKIKPILPLKMLDIIQRRRYLPKTQFYFSNRMVTAEGVRRARSVRPFHMTRSEKLVSFMKYSDKTEKVAAQKNMHKAVHLKTEKKCYSERLFVPEPKNDVTTVLELHPEFYSVIEGRPLRLRDDIKVYLMNIRSYAMLRQQMGYRRDIIMKIEKEIKEEEQQYEKVFFAYKRHVKNFEIFLKEDYQKAVHKAKKIEKIVKKLTEKNLEFYSYVTQLTILTNAIFKLDAITNVLKMYRKFLFHISPLAWRELHDDNYQQEQKCTQFDSDAEKSAMGDSANIEKILEKAAIELENPSAPILFFEEPHEMLFLFRSLELQSREYLIHLSHTVGPMVEMKEAARQLKRYMLKEQDYFHYYIHWLEAGVQREQESERIMRQKFLRILQGTFFDTVASPESLKLKICIEYVFERVFGKSEDIHENIREPMKLLELMYEEYNLILDSLNFQIVDKAKNDFFAADLKMMKQAYNAARVLREFEEMSNLIRKAFLLPKKFKRVSPIRNEKRQHSTKPEEKQTDTEKKSHQLSEKEKENLSLFTEWCEGKDPKPYLADYKKYVKTVLEYKEENLD